MSQCSEAKAGVICEKHFVLVSSFAADIWTVIQKKDRNMELPLGKQSSYPD